MRIRGNNKIKFRILLVFICLTVLKIILTIAFWPLFVKLFDYASKNGVQGIFNEITVVLQSLWKAIGM